MIDLHMHSIISTDGRDTPEKMMEVAKEKGLTTVAITDHWSVDGIARGRKRAEGLGLEYIDGIEIGCVVEVEGDEYTVDLLGYFIDPESEGIARICEAKKKAGKLEADAFIEGLPFLDIKITREEVEQEYPGKFSAYAIRRMLRERGYAGGKGESSVIQKKAMEYSFEKSFKYDFLKNKEADLKPDQAIKVLRDAGASIYMAHPFWLTLAERGSYPEELSWKLIDAILAWGVDGIEAYNKATPELVEKTLAFCKARQIPVSGGSDSHFAERLKQVEGIDDEILMIMKRQRAGLKPWC